jgi:hypothetical protein
MGTVETAGDDLALRFCIELFEALRGELSDPRMVLDRVEEIIDHARSFAEVRFCKGCVLPVVDSVTTEFFASTLHLGRDEAYRSLRCEGVSSLHKIYSPGVGQSGFSGYTWGTNYQRVGKQGTVFPEDARGERPCPDFGIVHNDATPFNLLGEVKFNKKKPRFSSLSGLEQEMIYYMTRPIEPDRDWHYTHGFGLAYAAGGSNRRQASLITDHWASHRFVIAYFHE